MPYDSNARLWPNRDDSFFRNADIHPVKQQGPHCVTTSLAILTGQAPEFFQGVVNTQDPISWSEALKPFGMQLAYCPSDIRRMEFYVHELAMLDDLFALCYYTSSDPAVLLAAPDESGWICGSHIVIMHRNYIYDPARGTREVVWDHPCRYLHTKRIFRIVSTDYQRGL